MNDTANDLVAKITVNMITEIFKKSFTGLLTAEKWLIKKNKELDFFGAAAKRYAGKLEERYNTIRIFGMQKPLPLRSVFVSINILEKITANQRLTIEELDKQFDRDRRSFGIKRRTKEGSKVADELEKFIVLGKPGAGKTTFLKYTALRSLDGIFKKKRIPILISLKDFSDSNKLLIDFIVEQFDICNFSEAKPFIIRVLKNGDFQILLDGLDEVSKDKEDFVIREICNLSNKYSDNQFVISCRIAAYNHWFTKFIDVEIADFTENQIEAFVNNWFMNEPKIAKLCWKKLNSDKQIKELACVPLLLTLLCLAFDESMEFPKNRAELYKEALDALLKKWDSSRRIKREAMYKTLSTKRKESLLSFIAKETFEKDEYFLPQRTIEKCISNFIRNIPNVKEETLETDSEAVLKTIEAQHGIFVERAKGIYSFSHLTFQEYFTAKYIVDNIVDGTLHNLIDNHFTDDKWREVILLTVGMLDRADIFFLTAEKAIKVIAHKNNLSTLLGIINNLTHRSTRYPSVFTRCLVLIDAINKAVALEKSTARYTIIKRPALRAATEFAKHLSQSLTLIPTSYYEKAQLRDVKRITKLLHKYGRSIEPFYKRHQGIENNMERILSHFRIRPSDLDMQNCELECYLKANTLLIECLNSECYVSNNIRKSILNNLLTL